MSKDYILIGALVIIHVWVVTHYFEGILKKFYKVQVKAFRTMTSKKWNFRGDFPWQCMLFPGRAFRWNRTKYNNYKEEPTTYFIHPLKSRCLKFSVKKMWCRLRSLVFEFITVKMPRNKGNDENKNIKMLTNFGLLEGNIRLTIYRVSDTSEIGEMMEPRREDIHERLCSKMRFKNELGCFINEVLDRSNNLISGLLGRLCGSIMVSGKITRMLAICKSFLKTFKYSNKHEHCIKNLEPRYIQVYTGRKKFIYE